MSASSSRGASSSAATSGAYNPNFARAPKPEPPRTNAQLDRHYADIGLTDAPLMARPFNPVAFRAWFEYHSATRKDALRDLRVYVMRETLQACSTQEYRLPNGDFVQLPGLDLNTATSSDGAASTSPAVAHPLAAFKPTSVPASRSTLTAVERIQAQARATAYFDIRTSQEIANLLATGTTDIQDAALKAASEVEAVAVAANALNLDADDEPADRSKRGAVPYFEKNNRSAPRGIFTVGRPAGKFERPAKCFVYGGDCLELGLQLKNDLHLNPVVLNMASHKRPGGGYSTGAGAQEENLFRRTNYVQSLGNNEFMFVHSTDAQLGATEFYDSERAWRFPLPEFAGVYNPEVFVMRGTEQEGYPFLAAPQTMAFIGVPAYARPDLVNARPSKKQLKAGAEAPSTSTPEPRLTEKFAEKTRQKMRTILAVSCAAGHDSVVLSAMGCGAFGNPPNHIARLFEEVLNDRRFDFMHRFRVISFAIFDDKNSRLSHNPCGNVVPFEDVFGSRLDAEGVRALRAEL
ncbi:hypothetical protein CAOG_006926 [Capsaspora owczarzaki ATCC 30864]|uniref:Microbial-type PARG catalytic domain-containing protein n=1 Tax=Capsaspora owczarzaki (strain ATCC 30864) TaxID=595528 RepID=A0A0D2UNV1_CAPO3|nr:hypothetical protein CAOG_006926 [Capsaspora owczarzaki ATCC 30864]